MSNELTPIEQEAYKRFPVKLTPLSYRRGKTEDQDEWIPRIDMNEKKRNLWLSGAQWQSEQRGMNKVKPCTCKESTGWTEVKCCNICGNPVEKFWTT